MKLLKNLTLITLTAIIGYSCSSSGGGSSTAATPNGIYTGTVTGGIGAPFNGNEKGIIYNNRLMVFTTVFDIQQLFDGILTVTDLNLSSSVSNYNNKTIPKRFTADLTGTFIENTSVTATFTNFSTGSNFTDGTMNLTADTTLYNKGSSTSIVAGSWQGTHGNSGNATTIAVDSTGTITSGSDVQGCNFTGTIIPADTSINVYNVNIISTGGVGCTSLPAATYTGFAWTEGTNDTTMNLTVADGIASRSVILTKI